MSQTQVLKELLKVYPGGLTFPEIMKLTGLSYGSVLTNVRGLKKWNEARSEKLTHLRGVPYKIFAIPKRNRVVWMGAMG